MFEEKTWGKVQGKSGGKKYQYPVLPDQLQGTRKDSVGLFLQCLFDFFLIKYFCTSPTFCQDSMETIYKKS